MTGNMRQTAPELTWGTLVVTCDNSPTADGTGPQKAPEGTEDMKSIDNLREYVLTAASVNATTRAVLAGYIDGIEREVAEVRDHEYRNGMEDGEMAAERDGWVRLPVDADGEAIHVGDEVTCVLPFGGESKPFVVDRMELGRDGDGNVWSVALDRSTDCWEQPLLLRHHHAPTVEDVLREFTDEVWNRCCEGATASDSGIDELVAEYAAKLRLAGDE